MKRRRSAHHSFRTKRFVFACLLCLVSCDRTPEPQSHTLVQAQAPLLKQTSHASGAVSIQADTRPEQGLNVILLTIDSWRADVPWMGYDRPIAPHLTRLSERSVIYENHRSVSSAGPDSFATLLSGRHTSTLTATQSESVPLFLGTNEWVTKAMKKQGVTTMAVHAHPYFAKAQGIRSAFDLFTLVPTPKWQGPSDQGESGAASYHQVIELLKNQERTKGQFFLWVHLSDPHHQYITHDGLAHFGDDERGRYDGEVFYTDSVFGKLLSFFEAQSWWSETALIVTGTHGEALGEHGMSQHGRELWDVLTRVPFLISTKGASPKRISAARTHLDVAPTILELMRLPLVPGLQGRSLVPEVYAEEPALPHETVALELSSQEDGPIKHRRAIVDGGHKLIQGVTGEKHWLFDLRTDPGEKNDLAAVEPERAAALSAKLDVYVQKLPLVSPPVSTLKQPR